MVKDRSSSGLSSLLFERPACCWCRAFGALLSTSAHSVPVGRVAA